MRAFGRDTRGAIAIYVAFISTALVGALVLSVDFGRLTIVRTQMQNAADAAASAASVQLDGQSGARNRATTVAQNAALQESKIQTTDGVRAITVQPLTFFSQFTPTPIAALGDSDSNFVQVTIAPRNVRLLLQPALAALLGEAAQEFTRIGATAVATSGPIICDPPPLLVCNPNEFSPPLADITQAAAAGRQILLRNGGNSPAPGNFGLVCPPSSGSGGCGAGTIEQNLAAEEVNECTATAPLTTRPGVAFNKVNNGVNSRFDTGSLINSAPNIITYPRDGSFEADLLGDGVWDPQDYWDNQTTHANAFPGDLNSSSTRYQVYLYELGESFARGIGTTSNQTIFPIDCSNPANAPTGFECVAPLAADIPAGGVPTGVTSADPLRRVMKAAVVQCLALNVRGSTAIDVNNIDVIEMLVTEPITGQGANAPIVGEIIRKLTPYNSGGDIRSNVRLVN